MPFLHNHKKPKVWWVSAYAATKKTGLQNTVYTVSRNVYVGEWVNNVYQGKLKNYLLFIYYDVTSDSLFSK